MSSFDCIMKTIIASHESVFMFNVFNISSDCLEVSMNFLSVLAFYSLIFGWLINVFKHAFVMALLLSNLSLNNSHANLYAASVFGNSFTTDRAEPLMAFQIMHFNNVWQTVLAVNNWLPIIAKRLPFFICSVKCGNWKWWKFDRYIFCSMCYCRIKRVYQSWI